MNIKSQRALPVLFLLPLLASLCLLSEAQAKPKGWTAGATHSSKSSQRSAIIELKSLGAGTLDTSSPLQASVTESINLELISPKSDWNKVYSIGRAALLEGDYRRALNAFKLALIKARLQAKDPHDKRIELTAQALDSVRPAATSLNARLGLQLDGKTSDAKLRGKVSKVFPGSLAWLAGLKKDDRIVSMKETGNVTKLLIERSGKKYSASITDQSKQTLIAAKPVLDPLNVTAPIKSQITDMNVLKKNEELLANHDVILIIDKSASMSGSLGSSGISKWDWCRNNAYDLATLSQYFPRGIDVVLFDDGYQYFRKLQGAQITRVFMDNRPSGGTELHEPLWDVLSSYFNRRGPGTKPLIIAILSDFGTHADHCRAAIFEAAQRVRYPGELTISLLEIGNGGELLVDALDNDMVDVGAPCDIVDATNMDEIQRIGLRGALVAALIKQRPHQVDQKPDKK